MLTSIIKNELQASVLCWLATLDEDGYPNVSPKEVFSVFDDNHIVIADIASPGSVKNIACNPKVCISCVHVFKQKGYKIKGLARILQPIDDDYKEKYAALCHIAGPRFVINNIIDVTVERVYSILAPSYMFYPDTSEASQIESALKSYNINPML